MSDTLNHRKNRKKHIYVDEPTKYVCTRNDLDLLLDDELKAKFQGLFYDQMADSSEDYALCPKSSAWRMFYKQTTPEGFLSRYGIDFNNPTVRDAVAFDLVKLDDGSVSNDNLYTFDEKTTMSPMELERCLLNKNYRINLVNLEDEWSEITYHHAKSKGKV